MSITSTNEEQLPLLMVVEYLESSMARNLLGKFPDNSAFDFDYSQSSIWSPLLPRPASDSSCRGLELSKKLSYDEDGETGSFLENTKRMAANIKRKFNGAVFDNISSCYTMKKKRKRRSFGISPVTGGGSHGIMGGEGMERQWRSMEQRGMRMRDDGGGGRGGRGSRQGRRAQEAALASAVDCGGVAVTGRENVDVRE
ncbi:hypothetical protein BUALT_Bualt18G0007900 [Buddleja alternifolia]|uniref:Uncharacterized protein n=1 Tax=Buddleja alternifolia TaxID=168488 RepID=A0AAV6W7M6_9LAMI|nr:hypothetical protein BUALT_Bualt18G0007900 [Buddleja alternifolia]